MGFDWNDWKRETTWDDDLPSPAELWERLYAGNLPEDFVQALVDSAASSNTLKAAASQYLGIAFAEDFDAAVGELRQMIGVGITYATAARMSEAGLERAEWKVRFTNLVSGRFTELLFERAFRARIEELGLSLIEETAQRNFLDYRVEDDKDFRLALNLKNAGVQMRDAEKWFGLEPEDTLPVATYKIFGSEVAAIPPLVYVYLVDWTLMERLREAYWRRALGDTERDAFRLIASVKGIPRAVEDAFIAATVGSKLDALIKGVGYKVSELDSLPFFAISGARCRRLFFTLHERSPYVYRQRMQTDPNVHISVKGETVAFTSFIEQWLASPKQRRALLDGLAQTSSHSVPEPPV